MTTCISPMKTTTMSRYDLSNKKLRTRPPTEALNHSMVPSEFREALWAERRNWYMKPKPLLVPDHDASLEEMFWEGRSVHPARRRFTFCDAYDRHYC